MSDWTELCAAASQRERVRARKLVRTAALSERDALYRILTEAAHPAGLAALMQCRAELRIAGQLRKTARNALQQAAAQRRCMPATVAADCWQSWFDGSARPNPGQIGLGAVLRSPAGRIIELSLCGGFGDSNQAEYMALIALLEAACQQHVAALLIYGDSRVVLDDINATAGIPALVRYRERALGLLAQIPDAQVHWIPRLRNQAADALAQRAPRAVAAP